MVRKLLLQSNGKQKKMSYGQEAIRAMDTANGHTQQHNGQPQSGQQPHERNNERNNGRNNNGRAAGHMNLEEIVHLANKVGMEYVEAKKKAERHELLKATERARAMEKYDDGKRSEAKIRRMAEIDGDYVQFLEDLSDAKANCERFRIRYESYKNLFEARRSMLSYQKAEMKIL